MSVIECTERFSGGAVGLEKTDEDDIRLEGGGVFEYGEAEGVRSRLLGGSWSSTSSSPSTRPLT